MKLAGDSLDCRSWWWNRHENDSLIFLQIAKRSGWWA